MATYGCNFDFGAQLSGGETSFRVWAPGLDTLHLEIAGQERVEMRPAADGWFEAAEPVFPGTRYRYKFPDGTLATDPAARAQSADVHGFSVVVDPHGYQWRNPWRGRPWTETVIYEAHAGVLGGFLTGLFFSEGNRRGTHAPLTKPNPRGRFFLLQDPKVRR